MHAGWPWSRGEWPTPGGPSQRPQPDAVGEARMHAFGFSARRAPPAEAGDGTTGVQGGCMHACRLGMAGGRRMAPAQGPLGDHISLLDWVVRRSPPRAVWVPSVRRGPPRSPNTHKNRMLAGEQGQNEHP